MKMSKSDIFFDKIPTWLLNVSWIGQGIMLAMQSLLNFIKNDGYAILLFIGACVSIWGLWRKNRLQIRREELALLREKQALEDDKANREEIRAMKRDRERRRRK